MAELKPVKKCKGCRKAPRLRGKDVCGICECLCEGELAGTEATWQRPVASKTMAINLKQKAAYEEYDRKRGVPTEYDAKGRPVFVSRAHRKAYCKAHEYHDCDGGYGDA